MKELKDENLFSVLTASSEGGEFKVKVDGSNKRWAKFGCQFNGKALYRLE